MKSLVVPIAGLLSLVSSIFAAEIPTRASLHDRQVVPSYSGTPIHANPYGVPTLGYNCAKLPSICKNVNRRNPINNNGLGTLVSGPVTLHYDTDIDHKDTRRSIACPGNWKTNHRCPETDQPLVVSQGNSLQTGFTGQLLNPGSGSYEIADPSGAFQGMIWSCDEWPPAM
jgi:hypothetical protein